MRVALVGFGNMGRKHAGKLAEIEGVEPTIVFKQRDDSKENHKRREEIETTANKIFGKTVPVFCCIERCITSHNPQAAIISSSTSEHGGQARLFLQEKIPVLVEKPLTLSRKEDEELKALSEKNETPLLVGYTERYNPAVRALFLDGWLEKIGAITSIASARAYAKNHEEHPLINLGVHDMDIVLRILGNASAEKVQAMHKISEAGVNYAQASILFSGGVEAVITVTFSDDKKREMVVTGKNGIARIDFSGKKLVISADKEIFRPQITDTDQLREELSLFFKVVAGKITAKNFDPWFFNLGTGAVGIMQRAVESIGSSR